MKKFRFENTSEAAIEEVLKRVGKVRFYKTIENTALPKPKIMANFKLVWLVNTCSVMYKYPGDTRYSQLFVIKDYEMPAEGWIWIMYND
ncbi:hypothetical protein [Leeuwenhoekiella sp. MAR_2009_132]|uniref:hypothetical protein n=1 Tax=Leeuwenhoekiella sp. MAR_2009_132 TaxID=1392489 RepID=UPI000491C6D8|nr:hypothetical protein [Leeuwenhoekiella sp. MAR_2009_132]